MQHNQTNSNRSFWLFGFQIENISEFNYKNYCLHPSDPDKKLYFFNDPPHALKNNRNLFLNGQNISLPESVVVEENLPIPNVSIEHVEKWIEFDKNELKICPKPMDKYITINHFDKMKMEPAHNLLYHAILAGIRYMVNS